MALQAYAIIKSPDILWNLALAEEKTKRSVDAIRHFRIYLHDSRIKEDDRTKAQAHIATLAATTGHLEISASMGAAITVDATYVAGTAPLADPVDVEPGKHHVTARGTDGTYDQDVSVEAGKTVRVSFVATAGTAPSAGTAGTAPTNVAAVPSGAPATSASAAGAAPTSATGGVGDAPPDAGVDATTGGTFWTTRNVVVIALGVGAVAAIGGGIAFGAASSSDSDKATTLRAQQGSSGCFNSTSQACGDIQSAVDSSKSESTTSKILYVGGGVLAVGAIAAFVFWPKAAPAKSGVRVVPAVGRDSAGVSVSGHF